MNSDVKELLETASVLLLIILFAICCMLCVKWGTSYQILIVFAGFIGTLLGVLGNKLRAGGSQAASTNGNGNGNGPVSPKV